MFPLYIEAWIVLFITSLCSVITKTVSVFPRSHSYTPEPEGVRHREHPGYCALGPSVTRIYNGRTERIQGVFVVNPIFDNRFFHVAHVCVTETEDMLFFCWLSLLTTKRFNKPDISVADMWKIVITINFFVCGDCEVSVRLWLRKGFYRRKFTNRCYHTVFQCTAGRQVHEKRWNNAKDSILTHCEHWVYKCFFQASVLYTLQAQGQQQNILFLLI